MVTLNTGRRVIPGVAQAPVVLALRLCRVVHRLELRAACA
jgi:hypothetical protein